MSTGGGPFEVAATFNRLDEYLDLCADFGINRIEAGEGFTHTELDPDKIVKMASERGLEVQYEMGEKHSGSFTPEVIKGLIDLGKRWLDAGCTQLVVEARESAQSVGLFDDHGSLDLEGASLMAEELGLDKLIFEAPNKSSQFAFLKFFGPNVELCNVRLEELLRVEIFRRGLHSDAFMHDKLRPKLPLQ